MNLTRTWEIFASGAVRAIEPFCYTMNSTMFGVDPTARQSDFFSGSGGIDLLLLVCILVFSVLYWIFRVGRNLRWGRKNGTQLPPRPPGLPLIGNLHQLGRLPHQSLHKLADNYGPLMLLHLGRVPNLVVSSAEVALEVMKTHDLAFASRPPSTAARKYLYNYKDMTSAPYGEYWRQIRRICAVHLLNRKQVQSLRMVREDEVAAMVGEISTFSGSSVNLSEKIISMTNRIISRVALGKRFSGKDDAGQLEFRDLLAEFQVCFGAFKVGDFIPSLAWVDMISGFDARMEKNFQQLDGFLERIVQERLNGGGSEFVGENSFLDILLSLFRESDSAEFSLDIDSVKALTLDMFIGGTDTTFAAIEWAMAELTKHPEMMKKVQDEVRGVVQMRGAALVHEADMDHLDYLKSVVKETLRLHPPVPLLVHRESLSRVQLQGYEIPAGTRVIINAWAIGRDPVSWERAEEFLPERFMVTDASTVDFTGNQFQFIPFGAGRRGCPAISFAIPIIELSLANLLYHFDWRVPGTTRVQDLDMSEVFGLTMHRKSSLVLVPNLWTA